MKTKASFVTVCFLSVAAMLGQGKAQQPPAPDKAQRWSVSGPDRMPAMG